MNVQDVMSREPHTVRMVDRLDEAARILWEQDCGFVPVVDGANVLVGVLTDRDLCMASYMQAKAIAQVPVLAVMARELVTCGPGESLHHAMEIMARAQVHRLPVVDARGVLLGVLSSNDLLQLAVTRPAVVAAAKVLATIAAVSKPRVARAELQPVVTVASAATTRKSAASKKVAAAAAGADGAIAADAQVSSAASAKPAALVKKPRAASRQSAAKAKHPAKPKPKS